MAWLTDPTAGPLQSPPTQLPAPRISVFLSPQGFQGSAEQKQGKKLVKEKKRQV